MLGYFTGTAKYIHIPLVLSLSLEGLYRFLVNDKASQVIFIGSSKKNMNLNPIEFIFNDASTHWLVLLYDSNTKSLRYTHAEGKQSQLEVKSDIAVNGDWKKFLRTLHQEGRSGIKNWSDHETKQHPFKTSGVCQDFATQLACELSLSRTFTYVLTLCLFRFATLILLAYYVIYLVDFFLGSMFEFSQNGLFRYPDFVFCLYMLYDYYEFSTNKFKLFSKQKYNVVTSETLIHVFVAVLFVVLQSIWNFKLDWLLFPLIMCLSILYYWILNFLFKNSQAKQLH